MKTEDKEVKIYIQHDNSRGIVIADTSNFDNGFSKHFDYTLLSEHTVTLPFPIVDKGKSIELQVESLKRSQERIKAEAAAKVINIDESIQNLLAIEFQA